MTIVVAMDMQPPGLEGTPNTDAQQGDADDALAGRGYRVDGDRLTEGEKKQADEHDPGGVSGAPQESGPPVRLAAIRGQRRHRRQMVRTGQNVHETGEEPGKRGKHHRVREQKRRREAFGPGYR
jgi:hypothetical protein